MRVFSVRNGALVATFVELAACQPEAKSDPADLAFLQELETDLALEQARSQQVATAAELGVEEAKEEVTTAPRAVQVASRSTPRRSSASSSGSTATSSTAGTVSTPAPQPRVVEVKHTKRDAAIGAVAGAAIGAVAGGSNNRVQGAVIGAVVGGVAGAVIGNNVDKTTRVEY